MIRMKQLRKERHLTQVVFIDDFNKKYGTYYSPQAVSMMELGQRLPGIKQLINFAQYFNVTLDYFLGISDIRYENHSVVKIASDIINNNRLCILVESARDLDAESLDEILKFIEFQKFKKNL